MAKKTLKLDDKYVETLHDREMEKERKEIAEKIRKAKKSKKSGK